MLNQRYFSQLIVQWSFNYWFQWYL